MGKATLTDGAPGPVMLAHILQSLELLVRSAGESVADDADTEYDQYDWKEPRDQQIESVESYEDEDECQEDRTSIQAACGAQG